MELVAKSFSVSKNVTWKMPCCILVLQPHNFYSSQHKKVDYMKCYSILGVKKDSDQETVRQAFLQLVKRFHPDSGTSEASAEKFLEIEEAYRHLQDKFHKDRWTINECLGEYGLYYEEKKANKSVQVEEFDIKHTAPQHRQYLTYDGWGIGNPSQRHRQYQKLRAANAIDNIYNHRIKKLQASEQDSLIVKDKQMAKNIKTRYGMDRLVEDLIQESMARGDFDNLSGSGKPLSTRMDHHNPYVDLVTHKINQVLIDNGFTPEWITLQKEIREEKQVLQDYLLQIRSTLGALPLNSDEEVHWQTTVNKLKDQVTKLNQKIGKYNLVVPLLRKQMVQFDLEKEANTALKDGQYSEQRFTFNKQKAQAKNTENSMSFMNVFSTFFSS